MRRPSHPISANRGRLPSTSVRGCACSAVQADAPTADEVAEAQRLRIEPADGNLLAAEPSTICPDAAPPHPSPRATASVPPVALRVSGHRLLLRASWFCQPPRHIRPIPAGPRPAGHTPSNCRVSSIERPDPVSSSREAAGVEDVQLSEIHVIAGPMLTSKTTVLLRRHYQVCAASGY